MGIRKIMHVVCDGPCGKVIPETTTLPIGWFKIDVSPRELLQKGEKPKLHKAAFICNECGDKMMLFFERNHYSFSRTKDEEEKS